MVKPVKLTKENLYKCSGCGRVYGLLELPFAKKPEPNVEPCCSSCEIS